MGNGKLSPVVVDTGPLIHLKEIGCLFYLQLFQSLHIPDAVWSESVKHGYVTNDDLNKLENINNHSLNLSEVDNFIKNNSLDYLDYGERECLYLCWNKQILHILTDDLAVRDAAKRLNIVPVGSLGIVVKQIA